MAQIPKSERQTRRELEIARELVRLLNVMPFEFMLDLQSKLLAFLVNQPVQDLRIRWEPRLIGGDNRRLDIVVPLAPLRAKNAVYSEIVFELKLHKEHLRQVNGYAIVRKDALVVSISQTLDTRQKPEPNVVQFTWTDLFWGLFPLLDVNAQRRVIGTSAASSGELQFDYRKSLGNVADRYLEDFLLDIKPLAKTNFHRVIVVTGATAVETANQGIYFCPASWDLDFDYLCVVYKRQLAYVGKVIKRAHPVRYKKSRNGFIVTNTDDLEQDIANSFKEDRFKTNVTKYEHSDEGAVTWLSDLSGEEEQKRFPEVKDFKKKGAVTQSHRYFDSPEAFTEFFTLPTQQAEKPRKQHAF